MNCGSEEEIQKWAQEDLTSIINWLQQQDEKVPHSDILMKFVASVIRLSDDLIRIQ